MWNKCQSLNKQCDVFEIDNVTCVMMRSEVPERIAFSFGAFSYDMNADDLLTQGARVSATMISI